MTPATGFTPTLPGTAGDSMGHGEDLGESGLRRAPGPGADQPKLWKGRPPSDEALQWLSHFRTSSSPILSCFSFSRWDITACVRN